VPSDGGFSKQTAVPFLLVRVVYELLVRFLVGTDVYINPRHID
jgi:hypothetical protein